MSVTNYVPERNRVYVRRFDHEEALRRYQNGERVTDLSAEYGVSVSTVYMAITPGAKQRSVENGRRWRTGICEECGGQAMRLVLSKVPHNPDGRTLCLRCRADARRERLRFDGRGELIAVRCTSEDCANGERWQSPENFPRGVRHREVREGGIHGSCRACQTRLKRAYRESHPEYRQRNGGSQRRRRNAAEAVQTTGETGSS